ncbi:MAG: terminase large subunit [Planctomycetaceae bacterium]
MLRSPADFRKLLLLDRDPLTELRHCVQPFQTRDFTALDPAWRYLARRDVHTPSASIIRRAYIERPRGHSKPSYISAPVLWIVLAAERGLSGLAAAADREQALLIHRAIQRIAKMNDDLCGGLHFVEHSIRNPTTGSRMDVISSDVASSWGVLPDFVICDELCHWRSPELWESLLSSAAKKTECILAVLTNAGFGRGWQWNVREFARQCPQWHFSSLHGPHAPWISDAVLEEQRALLPRPVYERLWLNIWQHSDGDFVTLEEAEACRDASLRYQHEGRPGNAYVAGIDYAEKHDLTVGCVCHREGQFVIVDRMDVVRPTPGNTTKVEWVENWIHTVARNFADVQFILDPHQLVSCIQSLERRYRIARFEFAGGRGNEDLARVLQQLILARHVRWYQGCGDVATTHSAAVDTRLVERDDLETELSALRIRYKSGGAIRFDHLRGGQHHDDRSFALAIACLTLCRSTDEANWMQITPPGLHGGFGW